MAAGGRDPRLQQRERFRLSQLFVMALPGVPAFYLPTLMASGNDEASFRSSGQRRDLNRERFNREGLERRLTDPHSDASYALETVRHAMDVRGSLRAVAAFACLSGSMADRVVTSRQRRRHRLGRAQLQRQSPQSRPAQPRQSRALVRLSPGLGPRADPAHPGSLCRALASTMLTNPAHEPANLWVVTDLDGTLLDHHYDWSAAKATLTWLKQIGISVIPCTSKTAEEVRRFRRDAELDGPFIVENGGAILGGTDAQAWEQGLGSSHAVLRDQLSTLAQVTDTPLKALEDLTPEQVTDLTGLQGEAIQMAQQRQWSVPFLNPPSDRQSLVQQEATRLNLTVVQGNRMSHLCRPALAKGQPWTR